MDVNDEFFRKDFDVEKYASKLLDENSSIPEQIALLNANTAALDRQLKDQISAHHEQLLSQATNVDCLEDTLATLTQHATALQISGSRSSDKVGDLYRKTELRTRQLGRLHHACSLLRGAIRVLHLSARLSPGQQDATAQHLAKDSQIAQELKDICESEPELKDLKIVQKELAAVPEIGAKILHAARLALKQGAKNQHQAQVGAALQAFYNLKCLKQQTDGYCKELINEAKQTLKHFEGFPDPEDKPKLLEGSTPGSASLPFTQSSITVKQSVWNDVDRLVEFLTSVCVQLHTIHTVASKKREPVCHEFFDYLLGGRSFYEHLWRNVIDQLAHSLQNSNILIRQTLEAEYPRLLRYLSGVFAKISQSAHLLPDGDEILRSALQCLESSYLSKSLARLFDTVNLLFQSLGSFQQTDTGGHDTTSSVTYVSKTEVDSVVRTVADELQVAKFDEKLLQLTVKNVVKTVKLFAVKCEQLTCTDEDASQVIGTPTTGQKRNVDVANGLHYFCKEIAVLVNLDFLVKCNIGLEESLLILTNQIRSTFSPLLDSVQAGLAAILATMHEESFNVEETVKLNAQQSCSLYVKELQTFVTRVFREYLKPYECDQLLLEACIKIAQRSIHMFIVHASLVKPISRLGRMRMIADFAQVELALSAFCNKIADDLGPLYTQFKAIRQMFSIDDWTDTVVNEEGTKIGSILPYSLAIHFFISISPDEFKSPHAAMNWSVETYVDWYISRDSELERLQFLKGTVESYTKRIQTEGKTTYVPLYPAIVELLKLGFDSVGTQ